MGWKTINGRRYYYRSVREGRQVRTEYVGAGADADLIAQLEAAYRQGREDERLTDRVGRDRQRKADRALDDLVAEVRADAADLLRSLGYRQHKRGAWRRQREH